ncbi:MAG TPA: hypothetical protein VK961_09460 [Chthoniobacter sp.]|nr:hypothetical protein [Chthoniobacter sp.]
MIGTWSYPAEEEPSGIAYLHFHEDGVAYQFVYNSRDPERRFPLRMFYSVEAPGFIRVRNIKEESQGTTNPYQINGDTLILTNPRAIHVCTRVPKEAVPAWFQQAITKYVG